MTQGIYTVGLMASGPGISGVLDFFSQLQGEPGVAFVVIVHQRADWESQLATLIQRRTHLKVVKVKGPETVQANTVYVLAEGTYLHMRDGKLLPELRPDERVNRAMDEFLLSLAEDQQEKAVAIIFWGLGTDAVKGATAIGQQGGYVIVQEPDDSKNAEMPYTMITKDHPNVVLPHGKIAQHLMHYLLERPEAINPS